MEERGVGMGVGKNQRVEKEREQGKVRGKGGEVKKGHGEGGEEVGKRLGEHEMGRWRIGGEEGGGTLGRE
jgi:hypothetical protein